MKKPLVSLLVLLCATFAAANITPAGVVAQSREFPRVVDLDGNGLDDLVHDKYVVFAMGGGSFFRADLELDKDEYVVDWLDVNGDGRADLMTRNYGGLPPSHVRGIPAHSIRIAVGAAVAFSAPIEIVPLASDHKPYIGDINGDGKEDLLLIKSLFRDMREYAMEMTVALSRGDGTFEKKAPFQAPAHPQWSRYTHRMPMGDLNRDGRADVVYRTAGDLVVLENRGNGELSVISRFLPMARFGWWETQLGDVDRDGSLDVIMAYKRSVQVLFGDGRSGFNRIATISLPQYVFPNLGPHNGNYVSPETSAPRSLSVGEFITRGRTEILGATAEGDIFVVALDGNGRLREVAPRISTNYIQPDIFVGSFRRPNSTDFVVTDNFIYGSPTQPKPGLFYTDATPGPAHAAPAPARAGRSRAVARPAAAPLKMKVDARDCAADATIHTLTTDGLWATHRGGADTLDAVIDENGDLVYRYVPRWHPTGLTGALRPAATGGWTGTTTTQTACGPQEIRITVNR